MMTSNRDRRRAEPPIATATAGSMSFRTRRPSGLFFCVAFGVLFSACAILQPPDPLLEVHRECLSKQGYESILPKLQKLAPGDEVDPLLFGQMRIFEVDQARGEPDRVIVIPGWIGGMSGGIKGAPYQGFSSLGRAFARSGSSIRGRHVFGYVWGPGEMNLAPQFQVITEANIIEKSEYGRLLNAKTKRTGSFAGQSGREFFRDLRVVEAGPLPFSGDPAGLEKLRFEEGAPVPEGDLGVRSFDLKDAYSELAFREAEQKLRSLPVGTDIWGMLSALGASFITDDYGQSYAIIANGFFGHKTQSFESEDGIYRFRAFGYLEGGQESTKLIAIFKNGGLQKVVQHTGLEQWRDYLQK